MKQKMSWFEVPMRKQETWPPKQGEEPTIETQREWDVVGRAKEVHEQSFSGKWEHEVMDFDEYTDTYTYKEGAELDVNKYETPELYSIYTSTPNACCGNTIFFDKSAIRNLAEHLLEISK